ncbi:hypothetical protein [Halomonas citrativorans]|uniref:hypothetical protein n=1 Tax=Halomonas TaxID=2745 RepID=UPI001869043C|nr:hypothetical protein [Halomonas citrativorans]
MSKQVVTLNVDNERLTFYAEDWPGVKQAVEQAMTSEKKGRARLPQNHTQIEAVAVRVLDRSRLLPHGVA